MKRKTKPTFYRKVGRRYLPVNDPYALDGLQNGIWVVAVDGGCTSMRRHVTVQDAEFYARTLKMREALVAELVRACACRPKIRANTAREQRAFNAYTKIMGPKADLMLSCPTIEEIVTKVMNELRILVEGR